MTKRDNRKHSRGARGSRIRDALTAVVAALSAGVLAGSALAGAVVTDGTLGAHASLSGPTFNIPASLGQQRGGNLFHSFSTFNLSSGEVASFSGPANVGNVIARITGGASSIDGTVQCTIPRANFYLINPRGVIFGPSASLDVSGSFVVTTANYLKLSDGSHFNATSTADTTLSSAAPAAFGFLSATPGAIAVNGSTLIGADARAVSLVGGNITITNGAIATTGGRVNLISTAAAGELKLDAANVLATIDLTPAPTGDIALLQNSVIQTDGPAGGQVSIRGGNLQLSTALISASATDGQTGRGVDVVLGGKANLLDSEILTDSIGAGRSGPITLTAAGAVDIDSQGDTQFPTGLSAQGSAGAGGVVTVGAASLSVVNGAFIAASTSGAGKAGTVAVNAGAVSLDPKTSPLPTGLYAMSTSQGHGGAAGAVDVQASTLSIVDGAQISVTTSGSGAGGAVSVTSPQITLDGKRLDTIGDTTGLLGTGIFAKSLGTSISAGPAGSITLSAARSLNVVGGAVVSAEADGPGAPGAVNISGGAVLVDDQNLGLLTGLSADAYSTRAGASVGQINIAADTLTLQNGALVSASSFGAMNGGQISITTQHGFTLTAAPPSATASDPTVISAGTVASGAGGSIRIQAGDVLVGTDSIVAAATSATGKAGSISINATTLTLDNGSVVAESVPDLTALRNGVGAGDAGIISVNAGAITMKNGGVFNAGTSGPGRGGTISVDVGSLLADGSGAATNTGIFVDSTVNPGGAASVGSAGSITVTGQTITLRNGAGFSASTAAQGPGGDITVALAGPLIIDGGPTAALSGIFTTAEQQGIAGSINVQADSVAVANSGQISSNAYGSGSAGGVAIKAANLTLTNGATISSDTSGVGAGGNVLVSASGAVMIDGQNFLGLTGLSADSLSTGAGGAAGQITVTADALTLQNTGRIATNTFGLGQGGNITVAANSILLNEAPPNRQTGITALSEATGAGGRGGDISINAATLLHISNGARVSTETFGQGNGGNITIAGGALLIDDRGDQIGGGIVADSDPAGAGGRAGAISINVNALTVASGGEISSSTFGLGAGGNVLITASDITLDAAGVDPTTRALFGPSTTGVVAASLHSGPGGKAGDITLSAKAITVQSGAQVSSSTFGQGAGGSVTVNAQRLLVTGAGDLKAGVVSSIGAVSQGTGVGGDGGSITLNAADLAIFDYGEINTQTTTSGRGGAITVVGNTLRLDGQSALVSSSTASGVAGSINVRLSDALHLSHQSQINTAADVSSGGGINISAGQTITVGGGSSITAMAGGEGGSINVACPGTIFLADSFFLTQAGANGGNLTVDPSFVILENSRLSANGGNNGGNITVRPTYLLQSQSSITATGARGVSGSLQITPNYNITGALVSVPVTLSDGLRLAPDCAADLPGAVSSFIVTGRGGPPLQSGGWTPDLELRLPTDNTQK